MIIKTLVENTSISKDLGSEHGLSLYIEANGRKILFDVGASELFFENAKKLDADISDVDYLVISHGHYDHGGGLEVFLQENKKAEVFLQRLAFGKYYAIRPNNELSYIGLDEKLKKNRQMVFVTDRFLSAEGFMSSQTSFKKNPYRRQIAFCSWRQTGKGCRILLTTSRFS
jgi:7,8-dihydropterin-6-yl-methyl-4-(beta-D-ribofuranosyl)aminobenzene 5'-phosphate synthase